MRNFRIVIDQEEGPITPCDGQQGAPQPSNLLCWGVFFAQLHDLRTASHRDLNHVDEAVSRHQVLIRNDIQPDQG
jgi:hypothetical protein